MNTSTRIVFNATLILILAAIVGMPQIGATPGRAPDARFEDVMNGAGLQDITDTQVISTPTRFPEIAAGPGNFVYLLEAYEIAGFGVNRLYSYELSSGQFSEIHTFTENVGQLDMSLARGADDLIYIGFGNGLYAYDPDGGSLDTLETLAEPVHKLAAGPSGLIYGIAGTRLFSYNPATSTLSDLGLINSQMEWARTALTVGDDGTVYGGYTANDEGHLFVYTAAGGITDKGQVLGQQSVNALTTDQNGLVYGGTNTFDGSVGRLFTYDPVHDSFADLAGSYGGVYALIRGRDNRIYGTVRKNGWEAYLFAYDPANDTLEETGRITDGTAHVSNLAWASDGRVYGTQTEESYSLVKHTPSTWTTAAVSGQVTGSNDGPIAGVAISAGAAHTTTTNSSGNYVLDDLPPGTYTISPTLTGYTFRPATHTVTLPPDATGQDFIMLAEAVSVTLPMSGTANLPETVVYTNTEGLTTTVDFPAGAVTETTTIVITPTLPPASPLLRRGDRAFLWGEADSVFAGHAFEIAAFRNDAPLPDLVFNEQVTITVRYSGQDVRLVSDESQLTLGWWANSTWADACDSCEPPSSYLRDLTGRALGVPVCRLGLFSLYGPTERVYLPLIVRGE